MIFSALGRASEGFEWTREACMGARTSGLLERKQARACKASPDIMQNLVQAARDTSAVCQHAFRHQRWNCSSIDRAPDFTPDLLSGMYNLYKYHFLFIFIITCVLYTFSLLLLCYTFIYILLSL